MGDPLGVARHINGLRPQSQTCSQFLSGKKRQGRIGLPGINANCRRLSESAASKQNEEVD